MTDGDELCAPKRTEPGLWFLCWLKCYPDGVSFRWGLRISWYWGQGLDGGGGDGGGAPGAGAWAPATRGKW